MSTTATVINGMASVDGSPRPLPDNLRYALCAIVAGIVLVLDQATKLLAVTTLDGPIDSWLPLVEWQLVRNDGAALGIPGFTGMFLIVTVIVLVLIARALPRADRLSMAVAYGLVVGGALGNAGDRLFRPRGAVVDFIDIGFWPTFNLADTGIVLGAGLIVVLVLRAEREARHGTQADAGRESVRPASGSPHGEQAPVAASWIGASDNGAADEQRDGAGPARTAPQDDDEQEVAADERR